MFSSSPARTFVLCVFLGLQGFAPSSGRAGATGDLPAIQSVEVNGSRVAWHPGQALTLGAFPRYVTFGVGPASNSFPKFMRLRTKLEGLDTEWKDGDGEMFVTIRFYNDAGDLVLTKPYEVHGESPGWKGALENSTFIHRREVLTTPPEATQLWVTLSSAGGPTTVGVYVMDDLVVSRLSGSNQAPTVLLRSPSFDDESGASGQVSGGWIRDGTKPSMAKILELGESHKKVLAVVDDDQMSHAEWHSTRESGAHVSPRDNLVVEWNEMYSIGVSGAHTVSYDSLSAGSYTFRVEEVSELGEPTGTEASLAIRVPVPYWQSAWFWSMIAALAGTILALTVRYFARQRMRLAVARLEQQRALEHERLRIAQDIHDDLGARVTEISMLSGLAENTPSFSREARIEFSRITLKSRDLVAALYETVWAVNPENDNLEAVGIYIRQTVTNQCAQAQLRCRLHIAPLPREIEISSRIRHNITMAAKEAVHNVIKYAKASQVTVRTSFEEKLLTVTIEDDGCGFDVSAQAAGNGLVNMRRRMENIGGNCRIESSPGAGTTIQFQLICANGVVSGKEKNYDKDSGNS